jgi:mannose-6-phosphate isomerase-like protein (cupin superfamily)
MEALRLDDHPVHLGTGASMVPQPAFPRDERAMQWYADYVTRHGADGAEGRLVSLFAFGSDWPSWEMHPAGAELVVCLTGRMVLHHDRADGQSDSVTLGPGEYAINPPGVWHTADVPEPSTALFSTAGAGTQHRAR